MKKIFFTTMLASSLVMGSTLAYAEDGVDSVEAGVTPDSSFLYSMDKFMEDLQLAFTFDTAKESELLIQFAKERLAEAQQMTEEEKQEFVDKAIQDYMVLLDKSVEKSSELFIDDEATEEIKEDIATELDKVIDIDESVEENLSEDVKAELEEKKEHIEITANVVKDMDKEVVLELRKKDLGFGQIAQIQLLANASGKTVEEIAELYVGGKGFGAVSKELGLDVSVVKSKAFSKKQEGLEHALLKAQENGDTKKVEKIDKQLNRINDKMNHKKYKHDNIVQEETNESDNDEVVGDNEDDSNEDKSVTIQSVSDTNKNNTSSNQMNKKEEEVKKQQDKHTEQVKKQEDKLKEQTQKQEDKVKEKTQKQEEKLQEEIKKQEEKLKEKQMKEEEKAKKEQKKAQQKIEKQNNKNSSTKKQDSDKIDEKESNTDSSDEDDEVEEVQEKQNKSDTNYGNGKNNSQKGNKGKNNN